MDEDAVNYDVNANKDDGTCKYIVYGCTDEDANNYDNDANEDDGTCTYDKETSNEESTNDAVPGVLGIGGIGLGYYIIKKIKNNK